MKLCLQTYSYEKTSWHRLSTCLLNANYTLTVQDFKSCGHKIRMSNEKIFGRIQVHFK